MKTRPLVLAAIHDATDLERTLSVTIDVARARGADIHAIRVVDSRAANVEDLPGSWAFDPPDDRRADAGARLAEILEAAAGDGIRVQEVTLRGEPEHLIPAYAQLHEATLLVIAADYATSRFWRTGRVVEAVARHSPVPLLVLPRRETRAAVGPEVRRILAPVDFSIASAVSLRRAVELSRRHGARLTLLHAMSDVPRHTTFSGSEAWEVVRRLPARLEATARRLRRKAAFFGATDVDTEVATGDADSAILEVASRREADLVVMGITHRSWLDRALFRSTLRRVLRRATIPVLVVPVVAGAQTWPNDPVVEDSGIGAARPAAIGRVAA